MSFEHVAGLLLPASGGGTVRKAGEDWKPPAGADGAIVWGREPTWARAGPDLAAHALRRERAVAGLRLRAGARVHRWSHSFVAARRLPATMSALRGGAVVEIGGGGPRVLDAATAAAGLTAPLERFHIGAGGQVSARVMLPGPCVLRVGSAGGPVDPGRSAAVLEHLAPLGLPGVPMLVGGGDDAGVAWSAEAVLPGRPPAQVDPELVAAVARFCLELPRDAGPPTAFAEDMAALARLLPGFADRLAELEARVAPVVAGMPSVLRHGDLWAGNLLVEDGRLTGVVDWDAWRPGSVPGTDLLHLVASARAFRSRSSFGEVLRERPWRDPLFAGPAARYWAALGMRPSEEALAAVGVAWWAAQTAANLERHPATAADPDWVRRDVVSVVER